MSSFIQHCESLFSKIKQNRPIQECQNAAAAAAADPYEPIWFVYYMFFAIHNPKMEEYIHKKASAASAAAAVDIASVIKNMIRRRQYTSTIVYQLYTHAYTNNGNVTHIYPKYKQIHEIVVKSYNSNHLKTTAVHIRRAFAATATTATATTTATTTVTAPAVISSLIEHITATATATVAYDAKTILQKINNIQYKRKDIIFLALICYLKLDEEDINTKAIFIAATSDDITATTTATTTTTAIAQPEPEAFAPSHYDNKYKYLYR